MIQIPGHRCRRCEQQREAPIGREANSKTAMITIKKRVASSAAVLILVVAMLQVVLQASVESTTTPPVVLTSTQQRRSTLTRMEPVTVQDKHAVGNRKELSIVDDGLGLPTSESNAVLTVPNVATASVPLSEVCSASGHCELCTDSDRDSIPECLKTGRRQSFTCSVLGT